MKPTATGTLSTGEAERIAAEFFGVSGTARSLPGEYDANFQLDSAEGTFVLKLMRAEHPPELLDLQCSALEHLKNGLPDYALPRVRPSKAGELSCHVRCDDGVVRPAWMLSWIAGRRLVDQQPHRGEMLESLGELLADIDHGLSDFTHSAARRDFQWDPAGGQWLAEALGVIEDPRRSLLLERVIECFERSLPHIQQFRRSVIHADANDHNVVVQEGGRAVRGLIDFGDLVDTCTVCEPVIAAAYAALGKNDPVGAAAHVLSGYHRRSPLGEDEIEAFYDLLRMRLAISVVLAARRRRERPDNEYLTISEAPVWQTLEQLDAVHPRLAHYRLRAACGLPAVPHQPAVTRWLEEQAANGAGRVLEIDLRAAPISVLDLSVGSLMTGADPAQLEEPELTRTIWQRMAQEGTRIAYGRWNEARALYAGPAFSDGEHPSSPHRTIHIGIDLFAEPGTPIFAPLDGTVAWLANHEAAFDYGPVLGLEHVTDEASGGHRFFTLYGHLQPEVLERWQVGQTVVAGELLAEIGEPPSNGNWSPHLHLQVILDPLELDHDFPGVALASQRAVWTSLSPDPNALLAIPKDRFAPAALDRDRLVSERQRRTGSNLSLSYDEPLHIVRGFKQFLYDETGRAYLDVYNNIPHVGHCHPHVVAEAGRQMALLNTNTRYLSEPLVRYAERLCATLPESPTGRLEVCYFVNSGSEANELALRIARAYTGYRELIVLEAAYHGHTTTLIDVSPYKFEGPGGAGPASWVHRVPLPDDYRGAFKRADPEAGRKYAAAVKTVADRLASAGGMSGFLCETLPSVGGQIVLPPGYLAAAYTHVRAAGGLCLADEVQVGFGRLGSHFWGFETQGVVPDLVVLGKPIANGHPMAAVITTRAIADAFANGMEFFASFGGNPVSCAAANAVLDVLEREELQAHALTVGQHFLTGLERLRRHGRVGDVRGAGLFLGIELVRDHRTLEPADREAAYAVNRLKDHGILCGTDGPLHNVIKIRPPMPFTRDDADLFVDTLDRILEEDGAR